MKLSALHHKHLSMGASWAEAGGWLVPEHFGNLDSEKRHLQSGCGIVDCSHQRKWEMVGRESRATLERLLQGVALPLLGRVSMPTNQVLVAGLTSDNFLFLAEQDGENQFAQLFSGQSLAVSCAHVTEMTSVLAGFAIVGKQSRAILQKITSLNLTDEACPQLKCSSGSVAGVQAVLLRLASPWEYALYVVRDYAEYLYDCLLEAGHGLELRPVGVKAYWETKRDK
jgi:heterotetrameric sarcosine oxidase gamma subunit